MRNIVNVWQGASYQYIAFAWNWPLFGKIRTHKLSVRVTDSNVFALLGRVCLLTELVKPNETVFLFQLPKERLDALIKKFLCGF